MKNLANSSHLTDDQKLIENISGALPARAARFQYVKGVARPYTCSFFALAVTWELTSDAIRVGLGTCQDTGNKMIHTG